MFLYNDGPTTTQLESTSSSEWSALDGVNSYTTWALPALKVWKNDSLYAQTLIKAQAKANSEVDEREYLPLVRLIN